MGRPPKFQQIVDWSIEQIRNLNYLPGSRFLSEHELTEKFGLSRQTVRHALEILERGQYIKRIRGSGTYISDVTGNRGIGTMNIGVISTCLDDYIFPSIIRGIETVLSAHGYAMQLALTNNKITRESRALNHLLEIGVDGLIVEPTKSSLPNPNLEFYKTIHVPVIFFNAHYPGLPHCYVSLDDVMAGRMAAEYLMNAGHTRIMGIFLHNDLQGHKRYLGYINAHRARGIDPEDEHILWYSTEDIPDLFYPSARVLERIRGCTAVVCYNDQLALRLIEMLRANGIQVPKDISVIGIDNSEPAGMCDPPLTTIAHPLEQLGRSAAENLISMISGTAARTILFEPVIIERKSVIPPTSTPR